jgi:spoIIIJ-associated protein
MSPSFEFEDKSVEKAIQKACEKLNIPKKDLKHDVISYGSTGIFGLVGTKKARIRVKMPEVAPESDSQSTAADVIPLTDPVAEKSAAPTVDAGEIETQPAADDPKAVGRAALQKIVDFITTDATITVSEKSDRIIFDINGGNAAVLIGRRG